MSSDSANSTGIDPAPAAGGRGRRGTAVYLGGAAVVLAVVLGGSLVIDLSPAAGLALAVVVIVVALALLARRQMRGGASTAGSAVVHYGVAGVATLLLIQLVPYGRSIPDTPVLGEPAWADEQTRRTMVSACFDCHSSRVEVAWFSKIAPLSWAVKSHVDEGRERVNYSIFAVDPGDAAETISVILDGSMPPAYYTYFGRHPAARLSGAEIAQLVAGLQATPGMGGDDSITGRYGDDEDDEDDDE